MRRLNIHIYPTSFKFESRILKETKSLINLHLVDEVIIVSKGDGIMPKEESIHEMIRVVRLNTGAQNFLSGKPGKILSYFEFYLRVLWFCLFKPVSVTNCHSLMVLPIGIFLKIFRRSVLIYDPHELETERIGLTGIAQKISKLAERFLIRFVDATIVVSNSIEEWYRNEYGLSKVYTIRNVPNWVGTFDKTDAFQTKFSIPQGHLVFIYQGILMEGRGINLYLEVFSQVQTSKHLVIMGFGELESLVKQYASEFQNIHFHPAVSPEKILYYTSSAHVGLTVIEERCLSYYYSLPNKFFEYLMAEKPIISSNFPDMSSVVTSFDIGWTIPVSEESLRHLVTKLDYTDIQQKETNIKKVKYNFSWENEEIKYREIFKSLNE